MTNICHQHRSLLKRLSSAWVPLRLLSQAAARSTRPSHYQVLNLKKGATQKEIKAAFVKLSKEIHPDVNPGGPSTHERFVKVNEAYTILSKAATRREYDFSLAASLAQQQNFTRHAASHSAGGSHMPGSGTYHGSNREQMFWDETIFHMRDKKRDKDIFYDENTYYGIHGVKKLSNTYILIGCFFLMGIGVVLHLAAIKYSRNMSQAHLDEQHRIAHGHLTDARMKARERGNAKQLELLKVEWKAQQAKRDAALSSSSSSS